MHGSRPIGQLALHRQLGLEVPPPAHQSFAWMRRERQREVTGSQIAEYYPSHTAPAGDSWLDHLLFALKREPLDLGVLAAFFRKIEPGTLESWLRSEPTGQYSRRAFFLYEALTGHRLEVAPARLGAYVDALDPALQFTASGRRSPRHRVNDNLLGVGAFCPTVRRTEAIERRIAEDWSARARDLLAKVDPAALMRAIGYLYTKETKASFDIEREKPSANRAERFVAALRSAADRDLTSEASLAEVQALIVEQRYAEKGYRQLQNYVGESLRDGELVHFVPPRPEDLQSLMSGWSAMTQRLLAGGADPVVAAAVVAFSFVYLHPFEDGNGRLHRFLLHAVLAKLDFVPGEAIFPVSAAILRDLPAYDRVLESFSKPLMERTEWTLDERQRLKASGNDDHLYRYFDATETALYLYDRIAETVKKDLPEELAWLAAYDEAIRLVREIVDMPDRRLSLLVRLLLQGNGQLSKRKRGEFSELTDEEVAAMESAVVELLGRRQAPVST
jgi:hypothetical protein